MTDSSVRRAEVIGSGIKTGCARQDKMSVERVTENRPRTCMVALGGELSCLRNRSRLEGGGRWCVLYLPASNYEG